MGNRSHKSSHKSKSKQSKNPANEPPVPKDLAESDYVFLIGQTGMSREEIKELFDQFMKNNPDAQLTKKEFVKLYTSLRYESTELLDEITEFIFLAFDADKNGI